MAATHFVDDVGTSFRFTLQDQDCDPVDLSTQTAMDVLFKRGDGVTFSRTAVIVNAPGTDGVLEYLTIAGDLSQPGRWSAQARVTIASGTFHSTVVHFEVRQNLT